MCLRTAPCSSAGGGLKESPYAALLIVDLTADLSLKVYFNADLGRNNALRRNASA